jgi:hypothetical protein
MDKQKILDEIFSNDPFNILVVKQSSSAPRNADERLIASFEQINEFVDANKREPQASKDIQEVSLYSRLKGIRESQEKTEMLLSYDRHKLLNVPKKEINSLDDILSDDSLGLLDDDSEDIFKMKHVKSYEERASTDFVARRKPCKDFDKYEPLFKDVQKDLASGKRQLVQFKEQNLREGDFYIHNGILLLLLNVKFEKQVQEFKSGARLRKDGRTRVVFENGTESNMLYRSLYKSLLANGKAVSKNADEVNEEFVEYHANITEEDKHAGYIYILKSKSTKPEIASIQNLFKIGYSEVEVQERIKNAKDEPTYLMAPVSVVSFFQCYNLNPQKLEQLLHNFFGKSCLNIDVYDNKGNRHTPREWFIAPLEVIEEAVELIVSGDIVHYRYDEQAEEIVER